MEEERGKERKGKKKRKEIIHMPSKKIVHACFFIYIFFCKGKREGRWEGKQTRGLAGVQEKTSEREEGKEREDIRKQRKRRGKKMSCLSQEHNTFPK